MGKDDEMITLIDRSKINKVPPPPINKQITTKEIPTVPFIRYLTDTSKKDIVVYDKIDDIVNFANKIQVGAGLKDDGSYNQPTISNYLNAAISIHNATILLDTVIKAVQDELDATQTGAGLNTDGSYSQETTSNYLNAATSLYNATVLLDKAIKALQDELNTTQTGAGLNTDGTYNQHTVTSNYINSAVSLDDADLKLDAKIKENALILAQGITQDIGYTKDDGTTGTLHFKNGLLTSVS